MNVAEPQSPLLRRLYQGYMAAFFLYLAAPLVVAGLFAFNDSMFPSMPWKGWTLGWFFNDKEPMVGLFHDRRLLASMWTSAKVGIAVSCLSVFVGTTNAFLFERHDFPGKRYLFILMIVPLVIPGVIMGIAILVLASMIANGVEEAVGFDWGMLRPGLPLVVLGQFSFLTTLTSLVIAARLKKFDMALEEAAFNLGASRARVLRTVTLPYLAPALISAFIVAFLVSFENFNTTLMLVGSEAPLTITMYDRMAKVGSTPVLNAVSFVLMVGSGVLALLSIVVQRDRKA